MGNKSVVVIRKTLELMNTTTTELGFSQRILLDTMKLKKNKKKEKNLSSTIYLFLCKKLIEMFAGFWLSRKCFLPYELKLLF